MRQRKKKKNSSRKIPPNRGASDQTYGEFVVVLENVYSEIDALGEAQDLMREQMQQGFTELHKAIQALDHRITSLEIKVNQLEERVGLLAEDVAVIKHEIRLIRHDLTQKVNREEFEMLEERVAKLEKELAVR